MQRLAHAVIESEAAFVGRHDQRVRVEPPPASDAQQEPVRPAIGDLEHRRELELTSRHDTAQLLQRLVATDHAVLPVNAEPYAARFPAAIKKRPLPRSGAT